MSCGLACMMFALGPAGTSYAQSVAPGNSKDAGVTVANGRLTVNVQNRSLKWLLEQIAAQSGVASTQAEGMPDTQMSVSNLRDMPLPEVLQTLLQGFNTLYQHRTDRDGASVLAHVWVYPRATEQARPEATSSRNPPLAPTSSNAELVQPSPSEVVQQMEQPAAKTREAALANALPTDTPVSADTWQDTLNQTTDPHTRFEILTKAVGQGIQVPASSLLDLAQFDASPQVRSLALRLISGDDRIDRETVNNIMNLALSDPDASVSNFAKDTLNVWGQRKSH